MLGLEERRVGGRTAPLTVGIARTPGQIREAQRLRWRVFADELGARLSSNEPGVDRDLFDAHCEHLVVRDERSGETVGTYRILPGAQARRLGAARGAGLRRDRGRLPGFPGAEHRHGIGQAVGLFPQGIGGGRRLLDQCGVLLRHLVHLGDRQVHLVDAGGLLVGSRGDFPHDVRHPVHRRQDLLHGGARVARLAGAGFHFPGRRLDERLDLARRLRTALRQAAGSAMEASNTPGLDPSISSPMRSWSLHATKLVLIMGLRGGGNSLNNTANDMNTDAHDAQMACAANGAQA